MFSIGTRLAVQGEEAVIVDIFQNSAIALACRTENGKYLLDCSRRWEWTEEELSVLAINRIGSLSEDHLYDAKRRMISTQFEEYHDLFHRTKSTLPAALLETEEMAILTDASLDFWLADNRI